MALAGAAVFAAAVLAVIVGLIIGPPPGVEDATPKKSSSGNSKDNSFVDKNEPAPVEIPAPKYDKDGMAVMPVTKDPREAAAGAAAVLWSVDTGQVKFAEDFRSKVFTRIMEPSPKYVGPEGQIHNYLNPSTMKFEYLAPVKAAELAVPRLNYRPDGWWWMLGDGPSYQTLQSRNAVVQSKAIGVYDAEQMKSLGPTVRTSFATDSDQQVDKEGATLARYWVRVEADMRVGEGVKQRFPASFSIYCDPPAEGGLCGVAALMTNYPQAWQHQ